MSNGAMKYVGHEKHALMKWRLRVSSIVFVALCVSKEKIKKYTVIAAWKNQQPMRLLLTPAMQRSLNRTNRVVSTWVRICGFQNLSLLLKSCPHHTRITTTIRSISPESDSPPDKLVDRMNRSPKEEPGMTNYEWCCNASGRSL